MCPAQYFFRQGEICSQPDPGIRGPDNPRPKMLGSPSPRSALPKPLPVVCLPQDEDIRQVPRLISWNVTSRCNLKCSHCNMDAGSRSPRPELTTPEGKMLIDQIADAVGRSGNLPLLILTGGEPLLREDILELCSYGSRLDIRIALVTNGCLISPMHAKRLKESGLSKVAVSLDSSSPAVHDRSRGQKGAWEGAVAGIKACSGCGLPVQINTTITPENYNDLDSLLALGEHLGVRDFRLFFLVPTGRGKTRIDPSPHQYERLIGSMLLRTETTGVHIRPTCAPQFVRVAKQMGMTKCAYGHGCLAGKSYCTVSPTGDVTPCPRLPIRLGNIRSESFGNIWATSPVLASLRDTGQLQGKCGRCEYRGICGGCRARAYGAGHRDSVTCGRIYDPGKRNGNYLGPDPWCPYEPGTGMGPGTMPKSD